MATSKNRETNSSKAGHFLPATDPYQGRSRSLFPKGVAKMQAGLGVTNSRKEKCAELFAIKTKEPGASTPGSSGLPKEKGVLRQRV
jgi:hypothetical protein